MTEASNAGDDFITIDDAAKIIGRSHWTIRTWLQRSLLTRYTSASRVVVRRSEILALVAPKAESREAKR